MLERLNGTEGFSIRRYVDDWQELIRDSNFQLCPRGKGKYEVFCFSKAA